MKRRKNAILIAVLTISLPVLTYCTTTVERTKYIYPDFNFVSVPDPYDENGSKVMLSDDNMVTMPLYYWIEITDYIIDTQELQKALKEVGTDEL